MTKILNLGFLASHRGSNLQAVIDACNSGRLRANPAVLITNNRDSGALDRAHREGIPAHHLSTRTHPDPDALDREILRTLVRYQVHLVVLAGYMKKLGPKTLGHYTGRIINVHPSLLPKFAGQGMFGMHVHEAVLAAHDQETGATVHWVDAEYDHGAIIAQCRVPVNDSDTPAALAARVLEQEHRLLVETLARVTTGELRLPSAR